MPGLFDIIKGSVETAGKILDPNVDLIRGIGPNEGARSAPQSPGLPGTVTPNNPAYYQNQGGSVLGIGNGGAAPGLSLSPYAGGTTPSPQANQGLGGGGFNQGLFNQGANAINAQYNPILQGIDRQIGQTQQDQGYYTGQINQGYDRQLTEQNQNLTDAEGDIANSKKEIDQNQQEAYQDLDSGLRNAIESFTRQLGAYGAVDSSASEAGKLAFARMGAQQRTEVLKQANQLRGKAEEQLVKVRELHRRNKEKLMQWQQDQLQGLQRTVGQQLAQLEMQKNQATGEQRAAIEQLRFQMQEQAVASAQQVMSQAQALADQVEQRYGPELQAAAGDLQKLQFAIGNMGIDPSSGYAVDLSTGADLSGGLGFSPATINPNGVQGLSAAYVPQSEKKDKKK